MYQMTWFIMLFHAFVLLVLSTWLLVADLTKIIVSSSCESQQKIYLPPWIVMLVYHWKEKTERKYFLFFPRKIKKDKRGEISWLKVASDLDNCLDSLMFALKVSCYWSLIEKKSCYRYIHKEKKGRFLFLLER